MATVEELAAISHDPDDPMGVFKDQLMVIVSSYMAEVGCCDDCIGKVEDAFDRKGVEDD